MSISPHSTDVNTIFNLTFKLKDYAKKTSTSFYALNNILVDDKRVNGTNHYH